MANINIINCSWDIANSTNVIGDDGDGNPIPLLINASYVDQQQIIADSENTLGDIGGVEMRNAQGFKLSSTLTVTAVEIMEGSAVQGSPTGDWTLRIETDNGGIPSGTLANANASVVVSPPGENTVVKGTFTTPFILTGSTLYWLVVLCDNQSYGVAWSLWVTSPSNYADGKFALSSDGVWTAYNSIDLFFKVYCERSMGTNETDHTLFYHKEHQVYQNSEEGEPM
jgi:hypothetical protein